MMDGLLKFCGSIALLSISFFIIVISLVVVKMLLVHPVATAVFLIIIKALSAILGVVGL